MIIKRYIESWFKEALSPPPAGDAPAPVGLERPPENYNVESLPSFNKLVRGRHGLFIANENDTYVGRSLILYGEFSELEWDLLRQLCRPGAVIAEVGANIGAHTVSISKSVGPEGQVIAIEPQPVIFQALCANLALNCLTNVDTFNCGCGSRPHTLRIPRFDYGQEGNFGGVSLQGYPEELASVSIEIKKMDDLLAAYPKVDLVKIDVEGMEAEVIEGGAGIMRNFRPVMYVENDRLPKSKELIELIGCMGYRMWWHIPPLFNPDNYFRNSRNNYLSQVSVNMLCIHNSIAPTVAAGLTEIVDSAYHPLAKQ